MLLFIKMSLLLLHVTEIGAQHKMIAFNLCLKSRLFHNYLHTQKYFFFLDANFTSSQSGMKVKAEKKKSSLRLKKGAFPSLRILQIQTTPLESDDMYKALLPAIYRVQKENHYLVFFNAKW